MTGPGDTQPEPTGSPDPSELTLDELRAARTRLQREDDVVSYVRRVVQARLDRVRAELERRRAGGDEGDLPSELRDVLSHQLTGGPARPPRPVDEVGDHELADELERICAEHGFGRLEDLDDAAAQALADALDRHERRVSTDRRERFDRLDALSAELVRRYRDGEASVDHLLGEP